MGFLDFLKKNKAPDLPPVAEAPQDQPPSQAPQIEPQPAPSDDLFMPEAPQTEDSIVEAPVEPAAMSQEPLVPEDLPTPSQEDIAEMPSDLQNLGKGLDDVPLPPSTMQDPDLVEEPTPDSPSEYASEPVPEPVAIKDIELPDFTDEDIAALEQPESVPEPEPEEPELPPAPEEKPWAAPVAEPEPEVHEEPEPEPEEHESVEPLKGHPSFGRMEPGKFLSTEQYFTITDSIEAARKELREGDYALIDAISFHEKVGAKLDKFAAVTNEVQETFMELDSALFEE